MIPEQLRKNHQPKQGFVYIGFKAENKKILESLAKVCFCKQNTEVSSQDSVPIAKRIGITLDNMIVAKDLHLF